ncbi:hypothetical protein N9L98_02245 [bacterium]|nr:hypothetical protein [bacterium]
MAGQINFKDNSNSHILRSKNINDIDVLITVRSNSNRLPNKCFKTFGDYTVIEHVIRRSIHFGLNPIVCTTLEKNDDKIFNLTKKLGIQCFRGPTENKLLRWSQCCKFFNITKFHSVDADDPFFCADEVKRSMNLLKEGIDVVTPSHSSSSGGATVGYSLTSEIVNRSCRGLPIKTDTEMMWSYLDKVPGVKKIIMSDPVENNITARLTLDYVEDYILLEAIRLIVGNFANRAQIAKLLNTNPDLKKINDFRTKEWSENQIAKTKF